MFRIINKKRAEVFFIALLCFLPQINSVNATDAISNQQQSESAPEETSQYGRLVGRWSVQDFGLSAEGEWQEGPGADWHFYWILGGTAIQDDWISPGLNKPAPERGRQLGTNIRIYNPRLEQWEMAWASNTGAKVDTFTATADDQNIVMRGIFNGIDSRITFHDITGQHFSWKLEQKQKETDDWKEIYRIEADREGKS